MSNFKPGDIIVGPVMGNRWKFIGTVDNNSYCIPLENDHRDAVEFYGELDGWTLAPDPFFEEGERYVSNLNGKTIEVLSVTKSLDGHPAALGENVHTGEFFSLRPRHFEQWKRLDK